MNPFVTGRSVPPAVGRLPVVRTTHYDVNGIAYTEAEYALLRKLEAIEAKLDAILEQKAAP